MSRILETKENQITQAYKKGMHDGIDIVGYKACLDYIVAHSDGVVVECRKTYKTTDSTASTIAHPSTTASATM